MSRIPVRKTFKLYVNGAFVRSEQGRVLPQMDAQGAFFANVARANRKDLRDALTAARKAQSGWAGRTAFNRSLILYRIAEMLEDRRATFERRLADVAGFKAKEARAEVDAAIDRWMHYGGWADKYAQVASSVNPVAAPYFNFTLPEPSGLVVVVAPPSSPLAGLSAAVAPVVASGNACVVIVENEAPVVALDFGEVLATSDVPAGVLNLLTGRREELVPHASGHMDVNAIAFYGGEADEQRSVREAGAENVKRVVVYDDPGAQAWRAPDAASLYRILDFVEYKTAWHPIGV